MPPATLTRPPLLSIPSPNMQRHHHLEPEYTDQFATPLARMSMTTASPTPILIPPPSLLPSSRPHDSPPFTPPDLMPSSESYCDVDSDPFPCTPSTPIFSPISEQGREDHSDGSYSQPSTQYYGSLKPDLYSTLCADALPSKPHPSMSLHAPHVRIDSPSPAQKRIHLDRKPHFMRHATSVLASPADRFDATNPKLYSDRFPPGHVLDLRFVREYAPGAEIGAGGFGFVVTATHRRQGCEVAVKFIESSNIPRWGWCEHPEFGRVPKEIMVLKMLDHPGIIKFLDFFQDRRYFYLVQELHGSPWRRRDPSHKNAPQQGLSAPVTLDSASSVQSQSSPMTNPTQNHRKDDNQLDTSLATAYCQFENSEFPFPLFPSSLRSSPSAVPSTSASSPRIPLSPPQIGSRPKLDRRFSHDLFECIEEHKRLSESQARYIFAQVVDAVHYLDSIGVAHRDIKDENVLIDKAFRVKMIDFGSASYVDPSHLGPRPWYQDFRGTIAYAPAEIFKGDKMHRAEPADVWALGILLSCLICGRRPFATTEDAIQGHFSLHRCEVRAQGSPPSRGAVSEQCWDLLKRCLDPDPNTRARISEVKAHPWLECAGYGA